MNRKRHTWLLAGISANLVLLAALMVYVASIGTPASEATRLRNAFLLRIAVPEDIAWTPVAVPESFKAERLPPSERFQTIVAGLGIDRLPSDWAKALALAGHLTANARDLGPIQADLEDAYEQIVRYGRGYCADFTQVYLGLAHAAGLFAREFGFSLDGFGGHGHAFIEIYDTQRGRWLWLDVYNNVHAVDATSGEPLSAAEFLSYAVGGLGNVLVQRNGPGRLGYKHTDKLLEYYRKGAAEWYLWAGNAVFTYEASMLVRLGSWLGMPAEQAAAILAGVHPEIRVLPSEHNAKQLETMAVLKATLSWLMIAALLLGLLLIAQIGIWWRWRVEARSAISAQGTNDMVAT